MFFVIRKKRVQVTFLHVVHHMMMPVFMWLIGVHYFAPQMYIVHAANTAMHALMYGYYFLSTLDSWKRHLWWKKYITALQLAQFGYVCANMAYMTSVADCRRHFPPAILAMFWPFGLFNIYGFCVFFYYNYVAVKTENSSSK